MDRRRPKSPTRSTSTAIATLSTRSNPGSKRRPSRTAGNLDGDPHSNIQEYIAGTDPSDPASYLRITNAVPLGSDFLIEWASVSGRLYSTLWSTNLTSGFQTLETGIEIPRHSCTDTVHSAGSSCLYQLEVELKE